MKMTKEANILIVDDQEINIRLLKGMLIKEGYTNVLFTSDARETLPLFEEFHPDLVLLDLHMPHLDGFEVMDQLSQVTWGDYVPILVLTGDLNGQTRQRALECGAMDFINKPFKVAEVLLRVNNFLQARLLHLQLKTENSFLASVAHENSIKLEAAQISLLERLAEAAECRADDTGDHTRRVAQLAAFIGQQLGMTARQVALLQRATPLHDIGKITIPDHILQKPGKLTAEEYDVMKGHVNAGARLLQDGQCDMIQMAAEIALTHHEKWDGSGYPCGLKGEEIPLVGRIVALADVFDALISERPYKAAWPLEDACTEVLSQSGAHFDPVVVAAFSAYIAAQSGAQMHSDLAPDEAEVPVATAEVITRMERAGGSGDEEMLGLGWGAIPSMSGAGSVKVGSSGVVANFAAALNGGVYGV